MKNTMLKILIAAAGMFAAAASFAAPDFYLATDKTFGLNETPYITVDGPSGVNYEIRVYRIDKPEQFFAERVFDRLILEDNNEVYADTVSLTANAWERFKGEFRQTARREFNTRTRSHLSNLTGVTYTKEVLNEALPGFLEKYRLLTRFPLPSSGTEWAYRRVQLPINLAGVYLIEAVRGKNVGYTLVVKTGITFITKQSDGETLVYAARRDSGEPVSGAEITIRDENAKAVIETGKTDKKGVFFVKNASSSKSLIILNHKDGFAISDPSFFSSSFYGRGGVRAYLYTERPIYRPGDQVFFKGIVRNFSRDDYNTVSGNGSVSILNPKGDAVVKDVPVKVSSEMGTFDGFASLPDDSGIELGNYQLEMKFGSEKFVTEFMVDAYKKPHYLVKVNTAKSSYLKSDKIKVTVNAQYHYGQPVSGGSVACRVFKKPKYDFSPVGALPFFLESADYLGLMSSSGSNTLAAEETGSLDSDGNFTFDIKPDSGATEDFTYTVIATVTSDDRSIDGANSFSVNRSAFFIKLIKDSAVYNPGDTVSIKIGLQIFDKAMSKEKIQKRIKGISVTGTVYTRSFTSISQEAEREKIYDGKVTTNDNGEAIFTFKAKKGGHYILEFSAQDDSGEETAAQTALWVSQENDSIQTVLRNLTVTAGKDIYMDGETAEVLIVSPISKGKILVTVESGYINKYEVIEMKGNSYKYHVKINSALMPNFSVSAVQIGNNDIYRNQIKIAAPPIEKFLNVKITTEKGLYAPGDTVRAVIETTDYKGKGVASEVSLAMVDRAIFQLQEDRNPAVGLFFYHPRTNNVVTTYSSAYRFFGYSEEKRLKLALNSRKVPPLAAMKEDFAEGRKKFKDTGYWSARIKTNANGKAEVSIILPDNITTWRLTALALTDETQVGQSKMEFISRKDLMINPAMPSYMIKGEKQFVSATLTNLTKDRADVVMKIFTSNALVEGAAEQKVTVEPGKSKQVYFTVTTNKEEPARFADIVLSADGGKLQDKVLSTIPLKVNGIDSRDTSIVYVNSDSGAKKGELVIPANFKSKRLYLLVTPGITSALRQSLSYLAGYPYGCIEQTMSRFMPLLAVKKLGAIDKNLSSELPNMMTKGLTLIKSHQRPDGSFTWYGGEKGDAMMSAYVYRGMAVCKKTGTSVDASMIDMTGQFLYSRLDEGGLSAFEKNYILFALSENKNLQKSMTDSLVSSVAKEKTYAKALAGLVLLSAKQNAPAAKLLNDITATNAWMKNPEYIIPDAANETWESDTIESTSATLLLAVRLGGNTALVQSLAQILINSRYGEAWKNSRDTASAVLALSEAVKSSSLSEQGITFTAAINNETAQGFALSQADVDGGRTTLNLNEKYLQAGKNQVTITSKNGSASIVAIAEFTDLSDKFSPAAKGMSLTRKYYRVVTEGSGSDVSLSTAQSEKFTAGDLVMVELTIGKSSKLNDYFVVEDPLPAGLSVIRDDAVYYAAGTPRIYLDKQSFDDRTALFCANLQEGDRIVYFMRAELPGSYKSLPAKISSMYYPQLYGTTQDTRISVGK